MRNSTVSYSVLPIGAIIGILSLSPVLANTPSATNQALSQSTDVDFDNVPLLVKYAHGMRVVSIFHPFVPQPPQDPAARARYQEAQTLAQHGFAYMMYHQPQEAIVPLESARALWPDCAATYRWLAEAYTAVGRPEDAIANYRLLFYGWPGRTTPSLDWEALGQASVRPSNEPSDYKQPNPEETDPILLFQFSLLLQQSNQYDEAKAVYDRGMAVLMAGYAATKTHPAEPLSPATSASLTTPNALQAATLTQLAICRWNSDWKDAEDELSAALLMQPNDPVASYYLAKILQANSTARTRGNSR